VKRVRVTTTARLHLGFLDLNGDLGRRFGSIGLSIDAFETCVELSHGSSFQVLGHERRRSADLALRVAEKLGLDTAKTLTVRDAIPPHAGLGSGTQLALAIASAFRRFSGLALDTFGDARLLGRGARSGVGAALFEHGGLVVDGGRGSNTEFPPIVARLAFPLHWRILLIMDPNIEGAHSEDEGRAFASLHEFPAHSAAEICRRTLMQILPGAAERNLAAFGEGVASIQTILGDHFAPAQGGGRFSSAAVGRVVERLKAEGAHGVGQSSWGPTGFAFARDSDEAEFLVRRARAEAGTAVDIKVSRAVDHGAEIRADDEDPHQ
jgi:beta-ribofuranosylaminobenzene 5'-phosphate synthase